MKKRVLLILGVLVVGGTGWLGFTYYQKLLDLDCVTECGGLPNPIVNSFNECLKKGYPVMESYPRQCKTPYGGTFIEDLSPSKPSYINATSGVITVTTPTPDSVTGKEFEVHGVARGWYFEGSFPIEVLDNNGKTLVIAPAQAQSDWMTSAPVAFIAKIRIPPSYIGKATIVLKKDNPSGLPEHDASMSFPITIEY